MAFVDFLVLNSLAFFLVTIQFGYTMLFKIHCWIWHVNKFLDFLRLIFMSETKL